MANPGHNQSHAAEIKVYKKKISKELENLVGMCLDDLPDCPITDWFSINLHPLQAARRAIVQDSFSTFFDNSMI